MGKKNPITRKIIPTSSFAATTALMMAAAALMLSIPVSNTAATAQEVDVMIETTSYMYWVMMAIGLYSILGSPCCSRLSFFY